MSGQRVGFFGFLALVAAFGVPSAAFAAEEPVQVVERNVFYLDWGFVGRPVSLDVNGGKTVIRWDAGDLVAPTILMVEIERMPTSTVDGIEMGNEVTHLTWTDPYHLSSRGVEVRMSNGCVPSAWSACVNLKQEGGPAWRVAADGRAYGHARVRLGSKPLPYMRIGEASWYRYKECDCAASPDFPKGTYLLVTRVDKPDRSVVVRVNDFGPERDKHPDRAIDLDYVAFEKLVSPRAGLVTVTVEPLAPTDPRIALASATTSVSP